VPPRRLDRTALDTLLAGVEAGNKGAEVTTSGYDRLQRLPAKSADERRTDERTTR
jgi:hypothetical protein